MYPSLPERAWTLLLILLLAACCLGLGASRGEGATYYVSPQGNDTHTCQQATSSATPRASINGGLACVEPGGTVQVAAGTYDELLVGETTGGRVCPASLAAIQQPCAPLPHGLSPTQPTRVVGVRGTVVSPKGRSFPGGGGIYTTAGTHHVHLEGLHLVQHAAPGSGAGVVLGTSTHTTLTRSEVAGGTVISSTGAQHVTLTFNDLHHAGNWAGVHCDTFVQRSPPCPHGIYLIATDSLIAHNVVRYHSNYGIQVSAEQGGVARVRVEGNVVVGNPGVGIRIQGTDHQAVANLLIGNGRAMTHAGSGNLIAHNTIVGYDAREPDPMAILGDSATIVNNLLYGQKSSWHLIQTDALVPPSADVAHHNMSELAGNTAVTLVAPASAVFTNAAAQDYSLAAGSPARGAGVPVAGVSRDVLGHAYPSPPDLGAYAASSGTPPVPPDPPIPPQPPAATTRLTCEGLLGSHAGALVLLCQPQPGTR